MLIPFANQQNPFSRTQDVKSCLDVLKPSALVLQGWDSVRSSQLRAKAIAGRNIPIINLVDLRDDYFFRK